MKNKTFRIKELEFENEKLREEIAKTTASHEYYKKELQRTYDTQILKMKDDFNKKYNRKAELSKLLKVIADRIEINSVSNDNIMQFVESYEKIYKLYEVIK